MEDLLGSEDVIDNEAEDIRWSDFTPSLYLVGFIATAGYGLAASAGAFSDTFFVTHLFAKEVLQACINGVVAILEAVAFFYANRHRQFDGQSKNLAIMIGAFAAYATIFAACEAAGLTRLAILLHHDSSGLSFTG